MELNDSFFKNKTGLVLNGGGVLGIAHLGCLEKIQEIGINLKQFKFYTGTSVGATIAGVLACNADLNLIKKIIMEYDFTQIEDGGFNPIRIAKRYGWRKGANLERFIYNTIWDCIR